MVTEEMKVSIILDILLAAYHQKATRETAVEVIDIIRDLDDNSDSKGRFTKKKISKLKSGIR